MSITKISERYWDHTICWCGCLAFLSIIARIFPVYRMFPVFEWGYTGQPVGCWLCVGAEWPREAKEKPDIIGMWVLMMSGIGPVALCKSWKEHAMIMWGKGVGGYSSVWVFRVVSLHPNFKKLSMEHIVSAFKRTTTRAILLDYDGTLMPQSSIDKARLLKR